MFNKNKPYNDLPPLPPTVEIDSKIILNECIKARAALGELKQAGSLIPNQSVLINTIPLLEAQSSSEIENIVTTQDELFRFANNDISKADPATKETLHYRSALYKGCELLKNKPLCASTAIEIMQTLRQSNETIRKIPGTKLTNSKTGEVIYTPPCGEDVIREQLSNWEKFINSKTNLDPLIIVSIMHYQFEAIHPFSDGNGRTGRILNILYLLQKNLLNIPVLFLSGYINDTKSDYYSKLINVTINNAWEEWILYMIKGVHQTATWTKNKILSIKDLFDNTRILIKEKAPKIYTIELMESLFEQPYCRITNLAESCNITNETASVHLKKLVKLGLLEERKYGRDKVFINTNFYQLLKIK
jgi:Fic family protein